MLSVSSYIIPFAHNFTTYFPINSTSSTFVQLSTCWQATVTVTVTVTLIKHTQLLLLLLYAKLIPVQFCISVTVCVTRSANRYFRLFQNRQCIKFCNVAVWFVDRNVTFCFILLFCKYWKTANGCRTWRHKRYDSLGQYKSEGKHTNGHTKRALVGHINRRTSGLSSSSPFCRSGTYTTGKVTSGNVLVQSAYCSYWRQSQTKLNPAK